MVEQCLDGFAIAQDGKSQNMVPIIEMQLGNMVPELIITLTNH